MAKDCRLARRHIASHSVASRRAAERRGRFYSYASRGTGNFRIIPNPWGMAYCTGPSAAGVRGQAVTSSSPWRAGGPGRGRGESVRLSGEQVATVARLGLNLFIDLDGAKIVRAHGYFFKVK